MGIREIFGGVLEFLYVGLLGDMWGHLGYVAILGDIGDMWGHLGICGDGGGHVGILGDMWGHFMTCGDTR